MPPRFGNGKVEKSKDFWGTIKRLIKDLKKFHLLLIVAILLAAISSVFSIIAPDKLSDLTDEITLGITPNINEEKITDIMSNPSISNEDKQEFMLLMSEAQNSDNKTELLSKMDELPASIYDEIKPTINMNAIKNIALFLAVIYLIGAIANLFQGIIMAIVANGYAKDLRQDISKKINKLPLKYFDTHETGDILSRITNDVDTVALNLNHSLASLVMNITMFFGCLFMMFKTNWIMGVSAVGASLIGFSLMAVILSKSQKYFIRKQKELGDLNGYIEEIYSGHTIVKAYNGIEEAEDKMDILNKKLYSSNKNSQFLSGLMGPIMGFCGNFGYLVVCVVGALLVMHDSITYGVIVAFMIYVRIFSNQLSQMAQAATSMQSTAAAAERVFEFFDEEAMPKEEVKHVLYKEDVKGHVCFKNVKFGYDEDKTIIKKFSAEAHPGQKIAIVGPTGAGKTTMVNLLMRFYDIKNGDITVDGISIHDLSRENIHDLFIMVLQDVWLFEGTVRENLKFNNENVTDEEIWEACKVVGVDHFIKTLPGGLDAVINDNDSISQGQKQLLTIARAMIANRPLLILDEATSNVDTRTEELVQKAMDKLTKGRTSFIIAHRLSTIRNADLILVMKDGNIIEQGNHDSLIKKNGFYAELYNSQFQN